MAGMGPPPKHPSQRRRSNATVAMTKLPAEGRTGSPPAWPLSMGVDPDQRDRESQLWSQLWTTPQAVAWERMNWAHNVGLYVRWMVAAESGNIKAGTEARQWSDRLGLNPLALLRLRWEIAEDEVAEIRAEKTTPKPRRLKAVDTGAVAGT